VSPEQGGVSHGPSGSLRLLSSHGGGAGRSGSGAGAGGGGSGAGGAAGDVVVGGSSGAVVVSSDDFVVISESGDADGSVPAVTPSGQPSPMEGIASPVATLGLVRQGTSRRAHSRRPPPPRHSLAGAVRTHLALTMLTMFALAGCR
jgi:hypothetical protein